MAKRIFYTILITIFLVFCFSFSNGFAMPTYEVLPPDGTPYPTVTNVTHTISSNFVVISAYVNDVSGILPQGVVARIEVPGSNPVQYMPVDGTMQEQESSGNGNGTYFLSVDVSAAITPAWDENATYFIDIFATDNLSNNSADYGYYNHIDSFTINNLNPTQILNATASPSPATAGAPVNLSATLKNTSGSAIQGETITFTDVATGATVTSQPTNTNGLAVARYLIPSLATGTYSFQADYAGNPALGTLSAPTVNFSVSVNSCGISASNSNNTATVCIALTPSFVSANTITQSMSFTINGSTTPQSINVGSTATLLATLSPAVSGETVTFFDTTTSTRLYTATTDSSGQASFVYYPSFNGEHTIEAIFSGDSARSLNASDKQISLTTTGGNCASNSSNNAFVCISASPSFISLNTAVQTIISFTASHHGNDITLTVTLPSNATGNIYFIDPPVGALGYATISNGQAILQYNNAKSNWSGTHTIEAIYSGDPINGLSPCDKTATITK